MELYIEKIGKLESFNIYDYPYFLSKQDAEHFIELIELEIIMNKLVGD
jgi:hypothetical protein